MCRIRCSLFLKAWSHCGHCHSLRCRLRSLRWSSASESLALWSSASAVASSTIVVEIRGCGERRLGSWGGEQVWVLYPRIRRLARGLRPPAPFLFFFLKERLRICTLTNSRHCMLLSMVQVPVLALTRALPMATVWRSLRYVSRHSPKPADAKIITSRLHTVVLAHTGWHML
jgi:hypothetical protein